MLQLFPFPSNGSSSTAPSSPPSSTNSPSRSSPPRPPMASPAYCAPKPPLTCACPSTATTCSYSSPSTYTLLFLPRPPRSRRDRTRSLFAASVRRDSSDRTRGRKITITSCAYSNTSSLVTAATWKVSILGSKLPVVVEFFAAWCGPCRMVDRVIDEIAEEYAGRIRCFKLNADHYPQLAMDYGVERVPTVLIFSNGQRLQSITGTMPKSVYVGAIEKTLE